MPLQSSGPIAFSQIQTEFGGSNPIALSEYYRGGGLVTPNNLNIPTSGSIALSQFYGGAKLFEYTITGHVQNLEVRSYLAARGWDGVAPIALTINPGVYIWSSSTSIAGLRTGYLPNGITIYNYGNIMGRGGDGAGISYGGMPGNPGGTGLELQSTSATIYNNGNIGGGGGGGGGMAQTETWGGGGGGAGGGNGGAGYTPRYGVSQPGGAGGGIGGAGGNGVSYGYPAPTGGTAGGGGGGWIVDGLGKEQDGWSSGAGGGRVFPGVGGAGAGDRGGAGGSGYFGGGNANGSLGAGGGGGWGAAGGASAWAPGGAGGPAIRKNGNTLFFSNGPTGGVWGSIV